MVVGSGISVIMKGEHQGERCADETVQYIDCGVDYKIYTCGKMA